MRRANFYRNPILVPLIVGVNIGVFLLWHVRGDTAFMRDNFLVSWDSLMEGRYWTLLTSEFSHSAFFHIFINMFVLWSFGRILEVVLGRKQFFWFYMIAAVVSSFCHGAVSAFFLGAPGLPALGASGAISGLVLLFSLIFPKEKILIFGIIPVPAIFGALFLIGIDLWGLSAQIEGGGFPIGHGAHLGGALTGILWYFFIVRPRFRSRPSALR